MAAYKHTQIGYLLLGAYAVVFLTMGVLYMLTDYQPIFAIGMLVMVLVMGTLPILTVLVSEEAIRIKFGVGAISKDFPIKEIKSYRVVENLWYYGWGIRYTPRGWLLRVAGNTAIEIELQNGKLYRIGTDEPQRLARALEQALDDLSLK
jgi:hypothetical protein